jgi:TorA maturation chaperone TorD/NAD-dependent dihydropyrimidine dehydrogenase PreA subunit
MTAIARATVYAVLARIFRSPSTQPPAGTDPAGELLEALAALDDGLAGTWRAAMTSWEATQPPIDDLTHAYNRFFVGPEPPLAHPYESVYRTPEGRLMGEVTMQVVQAYAEADVALSDGFRNLPDHVAVELEFMAFLASEEARVQAEGDEALAVTHLERQVAFLRDHLARWIPQFCHRVVEGDPEGYYGQAAVTLAAFVVHDLERTVTSWQSQVPAPATATTGSMNGRYPGNWAVSFRPERKFPCTLCGICAEVCRPGALRLVHREWDVTLVYDPGPCDGCGHCPTYCPERILRVEPAAAGDLNSKPKQLATSAIAPCASCGKPLTAEAALQRILERFRRKEGDLADEAAMHLCHACKLGVAASR